MYDVSYEVLFYVPAGTDLLYITFATRGRHVHRRTCYHTLPYVPNYYTRMIRTRYSYRVLLTRRRLNIVVAGTSTRIIDT